MCEKVSTHGNVYLFVRFIPRPSPDNGAPRATDILVQQGKCTLIYQFLKNIMEMDILLFSLLPKCMILGSAMQSKLNNLMRMELQVSDFSQINDVF